MLGFVQENRVSIPFYSQRVRMQAMKILSRLAMQSRKETLEDEQRSPAVNANPRKSFGSSFRLIRRDSSSALARSRFLASLGPVRDRWERRCKMCIDVQGLKVYIKTKLQYVALFLVAAKAVIL